MARVSNPTHSVAFDKTDDGNLGLGLGTQALPVEKLAFERASLNG